MRSGVFTVLAISSVLSASACAGSGDSDTPEGPTGPSDVSTISSAQATSTAENVGTLTLTALQSSAAQAGITSAPSVARPSIGPLAATGSAFGTVACPGGGRLDLVHMRDYTPIGGEIDLAALRATYTACVFTSGGSSFQIAGDLAMSGRYYGTSRSPDITVSGSLTTTNGSCTISGSVGATGAFSGTACGTPVTTTPAPPQTATLSGTWTGSWTSFDPNENCGRDLNDVQFVLVQNGSSVTGTVRWTIKESFYPPDVGKTNTQPVTGTVNGGAVTFALGPYTGSATFTSTSMTGSFTVPGSCQAMPFTVSRQ